MMTRKHYELIAGALDLARRNASGAERDGVDRAAEQIAAGLDRDNPRFNRLRFLKAAGAIG